MLTASDLDAMRTAVAESFTETAAVWRATRARSSTGGTTETYSKEGEYPCRLAPARAPLEMVIAGRLTGARTWWATLAYNADVRLGDELRVGSRVLKVVGVQTGESYQAALRVLCEETA